MGWHKVTYFIPARLVQTTYYVPPKDRLPSSAMRPFPWPPFMPPYLQAERYFDMVSALSSFSEARYATKVMASLLDGSAWNLVSRNSSQSSRWLITGRYERQVDSVTELFAAFTTNDVIALVAFPCSDNLASSSLNIPIQWPAANPLYFPPTVEWTGLYEYPSAITNFPCCVCACVTPPPLLPWPRGRKKRKFC